MSGAFAKALPPLTRDAFLGGRVMAWQPRDGFRSGMDAVLLAAAVPAAPGATVMELGCGAGVASICLAVRVPGVAVTGVEVQPVYGELARRNGRDAGVQLEVAVADLQDLPAGLRARQFDHVMMNPPYFRREAGVRASDAGRDVARGGETPLDSWVDTAARRLRPRGCLTLIQRAERLPELLATVTPRFGAVEVLPLLPRAGQPARLVLLRARKGGNGPFSMRAPLVVHDGVRHGDADDRYSDMIDRVLRQGQPLAGFGN